MSIGSASTRISTTTRLAVLAAAFMLALGAGLLAGCQSNDTAASSSAAQATASSATEATQAAATIEVEMTIDATEGEGEKTTETITIEEGATVFDVLQASNHKLDVQDSAYGKYVAGIDGVAAGDVTDSSGWMVALNGEDLMVSADEQEVKAGDKIEWYFVTSFDFD